MVTLFGRCDLKFSIKYFVIGIDHQIFRLSLREYFRIPHIEYILPNSAIIFPNR